MFKFILLFLILSIITGPALGQARETIRIVGSSTVYPFSTVVAERFGRFTEHPTPIVESTGTGGGFKLFCQGIGAEYADIVNASRAIKPSEHDLCAANGIPPSDILEVQIGYDGIVIANSRSGETLYVTRQQLFLALAQRVPYRGRWVENYHYYWSDIHQNLPPTRIQVYGPPPTSGTRDAFIELVMEVGCDAYSQSLKSLSQAEQSDVCAHIREDGAFIEAGENDSLIIQKLIRNPRSFGIFGYSFLEQNIDRVQGAVIEGSGPNFESIESGSYPVSRPLFFYVKRPHLDIISGVRAFVTEFISPRSLGEDGYLIDRGLIPLAEEEISVLRNSLN